MTVGKVHLPLLVAAMNGSDVDQASPLEQATPPIILKNPHSHQQLSPLANLSLLYPI